MRTPKKCYSFPEDEESFSNPSASLTYRKNRRKRRRTHRPRNSRKSISILMDQEKEFYHAEVLPHLDPQEIERSNRMRSLRGIWHKNREFFIKHLDDACLHDIFEKVDGWKRFTRSLIEGLELGIPITDEETIQSCQDYAAELRKLHMDCKKLKRYTSRSDARHVTEECKDRLKNIFGRKPLKLKKKPGASTSSGRKSSSSRTSYGGKSSRTAGASDPSVHMPCASWQERVRVSNALAPILATWPTYLSGDILVNLCDHICSQPIIYSVILTCDDNQKKQFIKDYLEKFHGS